ncbi:MAG: glycosyltransferase family 9 protein [Planctomycetes bacterium]|nr:glycosyltransferase family 9 protein [Planctomycetota bacterium]
MVRSVLVSNLNNLGDVVCSTAALDLLRRHFPQARIGLMVKAEAEGVVRGHPLLDDLHVYRYRSGSDVGGLWGMAAAVRGKYETFLSLDRKARSALVAWLAGIPVRIIPDRLHLATHPRWWMPWLATRVLRFSPDAHRSLVDMFEEPVRRAFSLTGKGTTSLPPIGVEERQRAADILRPAGRRPVIGFSVRAQAPLKNWPPERFAALMDRLQASHDAFLYITGAPGDHEYIEKLLEMRTCGSALNLAGRTSLLDTAALAAASQCFVTLDTGAVHIAGNSGLRNLVCIFTCTIPEGVLESARQADVVWTGEPCCPCQGCTHPPDREPCRLGIGVEQVYHRVVTLLATERAGWDTGPGREG